MKRNYVSLLILVSFLLCSCLPVPTAAPTRRPQPTPTATPQPVPSATSTSSAPGITPTSNIPFQLTKWYEAGTGDIRLILYLDDPSELNAVQVLRDGLMAELAHSGSLPSGYPKFTNLPLYTAQRCDVNGRHAIQLSEAPDNYFVLPLCDQSQQEASMTIYILRSGSLPFADYQTPRLYIGVGQSGTYGISYRQAELIWQAFVNLGLAAYPGTDSP